MGIDKDDGDNIRNDTRAPFAWEGLDRIGRDSEYGTAFPGLAVKRLSHLRSYLLMATRDAEGVARGRRLEGLRAVHWRGFWVSSIAVLFVLTALAVLPWLGVSAALSGASPPLGVILSSFD